MVDNERVGACGPVSAGPQPEALENNPHRNRNEIARVNTKIPPFWKANPALWFCQLESQFITSGVTSERTKYHFVVSAIESEVLSQVSDIIINPPAVEQYQTLKTRLLERYVDSEEKRLQKLLKEMELGDRKPSHLLREMRDLARNAVNDDFLKSLWLQLLPHQTQAILSASNDVELNRLALLADKINEVTSTHPQVNIVSSDKDRVSALEKHIFELTMKIESLVDSNHHRNSQRSTLVNRSHSRKRSQSREHDVCWYHFKFKKDATKCRPPCKFSEN